MCEAASSIGYAGLGDSSNANRKVAIVAVLFVYLVQVFATLLKYFFMHKEVEDKVEIFNRFTNDNIYRSFFFLLLTMVLTMQVATAFAAVLPFLYVPAPILLLVSYLADKPKFRLIAHIYQAAIFVLMIFYAAINPWCRFLFHRYGNSIYL